MILEAVKGFFDPSDKEEATFGIIMGIVLMLVGGFLMPWVLNVVFTIVGLIGFVTAVTWAVSNPEPTE